MRRREHKAADATVVEPDDLVEWMVGHLSKRCTEHPDLVLARLIGDDDVDPRKSLEAKIRAAIERRELPSEAWIVGRADGRCLRRPVIQRQGFAKFLGLGKYDRIMNDVWPFADRTQDQIDELCRRWPGSVSYGKHEFIKALDSIV